MATRITRKEFLSMSGTGLTAAALLLATKNDVFAAKTPRKAPVLWTTPEMLAEARTHLAAKQAPWQTAGERTRTRALAHTTPATPYQGSEYLRYFHTGREQAGWARDAALTYALTGDARFADQARAILLAWARDIAQNPSPASDHPINQSLVIARVMAIFCYAYTLVYEQVPDAERRTLEDWMTHLVQPIRDGQKRWVENDYFGKQLFNNHVGAQVMGMTMLGFTLGDQDLVQYALEGDANPRNFARLVEGVVLMPGDTLLVGDPTNTGAPAVQAGEGYDRYRSREGHGLGYTALHLRLLTLIAEAAHNNGATVHGQDPYLFTGTQGRKLETSYDFYAEFFITRDASVQGGYYKKEHVNLEDACLYEIAHRRYPDNPKIREVLAAHDRVVDDAETFGWTAVLTHGLPLTSR